MNARHVLLASLMVAVAAMVSGCFVSHTETTREVTVHEGYYDRDHHRYWHDNQWYDCETDHGNTYCH